MTEMKSDILDLKRMVERQGAMLTSLQSANSDDEIYELPDGLQFPLKSLEDVDLLETHLEADKNLQKYLVWIEQFHFELC